MASHLPRGSLAPQPCPAGPAHGPGGSYATVLRPPAWEVPVGLPARGCHSRGWQSRGSVRGVHRQLEPSVVNVIPSLSAKRAVPRVPWRSVHAPETKVLKLSRGTARGGTGGGGAKTRGSTAASSFSHSSRNFCVFRPPSLSNQDDVLGSAKPATLGLCVPAPASLSLASPPLPSLSPWATAPQTPFLTNSWIFGGKRRVMNVFCPPSCLCLEDQGTRLSSALILASQL